MGQALSIQSIEEFDKFIGGLLEVAHTSSKTLEEYLRSLWLLMEQHQDEQLTWTLLGQLFKAAFTQEPPPFDDAWLAYTERPAGFYPDPIPDDYAVANEMVLYQIADLQRMREAGLLDQAGYILWGGFDSPTGHRWYNFDIEGFLGCATMGLDNSNPAIECGWGFLADFLFLGQIYE